MARLSIVVLSIIVLLTLHLTDAKSKSKAHKRDNNAAEYRQEKYSRDTRSVPKEESSNGKTCGKKETQRYARDSKRSNKVEEVGDGSCGCDSKISKRSAPAENVEPIRKKKATQQQPSNEKFNSGKSAKAYAEPAEEIPRPRKQWNGKEKGNKKEQGSRTKRPQQPADDFVEEEIIPRKQEQKKRVVVVDEYYEDEEEMPVNEVDEGFDEEDEEFL